MKKSISLLLRAAIKEDIGTYFALGTKYYEDGQRDKGQFYFQKALALKPGKILQAKIFNNMARYLSVENPQKAKEYLSIALEYLKG